jgi:hypothetical protein
MTTAAIDAEMVSLSAEAERVQVCACPLRTRLSLVTRAACRRASMRLGQTRSGRCVGRPAGGTWCRDSRSVPWCRFTPRT